MPKRTAKPKNVIANEAPKRSHHKRKAIPSGAPADPDVIARSAPKNVIARSPQATRQSIHRGQIAAPVGLAMTGLNDGLAMTGLNDGLAMTTLSKDGLPSQAFAIVPDPTAPTGWQLPHHTGQVVKDAEGSVDWPLIEKSTLLLSLQGNEGCRVSADPAHIIDAARHIAGHYRNAGKPIPIDLCVLI